MSSVLGSLNRKSKRNFKKLSQEQKSEIIQSALTDKVSGVMAKEVSKSMIYGISFAKEQLYKKYVSKIDELHRNGEDANDEIQKLLSHIRSEHFKFVQWENEHNEKMEGE